MKKHCYSAFILGISVALFSGVLLGQPVRAQDSEQITRTLVFQKPGESPQQLSVSGTQSQVDSAVVVGAISLGGGVPIDAVQTGINLTLAGADAKSVVDLLLAMGGMVTNGQIDLTRLALAINAYNDIIEKADLQTLKALQNIPKFMDFRTFLLTTSKPITQS
jgi:hypothetical protein